MPIRPSKVTEPVKRLLTNHPRLRDDDSALIANIWNEQMNVIALSGVEVLKKIASGEVASSESITRCRRKLQELNPELRGTKWKSRHDDEDNVIDDINKIT